MTEKESVKVNPNSIKADVEIPTEHDVKVSSRNFRVVSTSSMNLADGTDIPEWLDEAITEQIRRGTLSLEEALSDITDFVRQLETGVNQQITGLQTADESSYQLLTTNISRLDTDVAAAIQLIDTKVTAEQASALSTNILTAQFTTDTSEANAWFIDQSSTMANAIGSHATQLTALVSSYNGISASIAEIDQIVVGNNTVIESPTEPLNPDFGWLWLDTSYTPPIQYKWLGVEIGWIRSDASAVSDVSALELLMVNNVSELQAQLDGEIASWFEDYVPTLSNEPTATWVATDTTNGNTIEQDRHLGDLFYDTSSGAAYRFTVTAGVYSWTIITDTAITRALADAATAQSTADGKVTTYYTTLAAAITMAAGWTTAEKTNNTGDLLIDSTDSNNTMYRYNGTVWESVQDKGIGWAASASKLVTAPDGSITGWAFADGSNVQSHFNVYAQNFKVSDGTTGYTPFEIAGNDISFSGKVSFDNVTEKPVINQTFVQITEPTVGMIAGDTWIDTDDNDKVYTYTGTTWEVGGTEGATTYMQTTAPTANLLVGDLWFDTDDNYKQWRWNGTSWEEVLYSAAVDINSGTTTIDGDKITAGTVYSNAFFGNVIYNLIWNGSAWIPATSTNYTMKIDLAGGSIHIK